MPSGTREDMRPLSTTERAALYISLAVLCVLAFISYAHDDAIAGNLFAIGALITAIMAWADYEARKEVGRTPSFYDEPDRDPCDPLL